jgi:hypothetical protein
VDEVHSLRVYWRACERFPKPEAAMQPSKKQSAPPTTTASGVTLEEAVRILLQGTPADLPAATVARIREDARLQFDYPGETVAYVDSWRGRGQNRRLTREVIAHAADVTEFYRRFDRLPDALRARATVRYVTAPDQLAADR